MANGCFSSQAQLLIGSPPVPSAPVLIPRPEWPEWTLSSTCCTTGSVVNSSGKQRGFGRKFGHPGAARPRGERVRRDAQGQKEQRHSARVPILDNAGNEKAH